MFRESCGSSTPSNLGGHFHHSQRNPSVIDFSFYSIAIGEHTCYEFIPFTFTGVCFMAWHSEPLENVSRAPEKNVHLAVDGWGRLWTCDGSAQRMVSSVPPVSLLTFSLVIQLVTERGVDVSNSLLLKCLFLLSVLTVFVSCILWLCFGGTYNYVLQWFDYFFVFRNIFLF